jgi:hypothetical protein
MKMICKATCQFRGVTRNGAILDIEGAELDLPIVKHNFIPAAVTDQAPPVLKFSNGNPLKKEGEAVPPVATGTIKPEADTAAAPAGLTNGTPKPEVTPDLPPANEPPAPPPALDFPSMTVDQLKKHLDSVGAKYTTRSTKDDLVKLATAAQELIKE